ncbi:hypothetical protein JHK84_051920 [Glycine max]|nr:hypothetical protein JHK86_051878 [Glycine max]KAG5081882.1 hypothetical protein JHK84_051920 [Glycine max]
MEALNEIAVNDAFLAIFSTSSMLLIKTLAQGNALKTIAKLEFQAELKFRERAKDSSLAMQELVAEQEFCCVHLRSIYFV